MAKRIDSLSDLGSRYDVILCDVWGVLHNGVVANADASAALKAARERGQTVVLITNSPRVSPQVVAQLRTIGVSDDAYDRIVTSGDVHAGADCGRAEEGVSPGPRPRPGADRGHRRRARAGRRGGLDRLHRFLRRRDRDAGRLYRHAEGVPGPRRADDLRQSRPDRRARPQDDPLRRSHGRLLQHAGGKTRVAGKPHRPIYEASLAAARGILGDLDLSRVVAIGDGMPTDVRGALGYGLDLLYISQGIHAAEYTIDCKPDETILHAFLEREQAAPTWWMPTLS